MKDLLDLPVEALPFVAIQLRSAFVELYAGKACAIGLIVFFFILILTEINNRYVRVEK